MSIKYNDYTIFPLIICKIACLMYASVCVNEMPDLHQFGVRAHTHTHKMEMYVCSIYTIALETIYVIPMDCFTRFI